MLLMLLMLPMLLMLLMLPWLVVVDMLSAATSRTLPGHRAFLSTPSASSPFGSNASRKPQEFSIQESRELMASFFRLVRLIQDGSFVQPWAGLFSIEMVSSFLA
jgi:hypothetical protein